MFLRIGGIPAVGKTTVAGLLVDELRAVGLDADTVHGANILAEILGVKKSQLSQIPEETKAAAREEMYRRIYEADAQSPNRLVVRDAHYCMRDLGTGDFVECPLQPGDKNQMALMMLLISPETEIARRRQEDLSKRPDRPLDLAIIRQEAEFELATAKRQAETLGIPLLLFQNDGRTPQETTREIALAVQERLKDPEISLKGERERLFR